MVSSRVKTRILTISQALLQLRISRGRRKRPENPQRILVAHHLLLGDTLTLTPLLAKLRKRFPQADIVMTAPTAIAPLYEKRPYGVTVWRYDPRDPDTVAAMIPQGGFDWAFVPGDNRYSWLAAALDARWITAHAHDTPAYKSWPVDELIPYPDKPAAWGDAIAEMAPGPPPAPFETRYWLAPTCAPFDLPTQPYAVLHVGASSPLKLWGPEKWRALAEHLTTQGLNVVWSGGKSETGIVQDIDPANTHQSFAGLLDLQQLWRLIDNAQLLVCPDTGVAHLGRIIGTPTVTLFGPGSSVLSGAGEFWRDSRFYSVTVAPFPCRDQHRVFNRHVSSIQLCRRTTKECSNNLCMQAIDVDMVKEKVNLVLEHI